MAYFSDLSPYRYNGSHQEGVVHVGWLGEGQPFSQGMVAPHLVEKLKLLANHPVELYRGLHICEICPSHVTTIPVEKEDPRYEQAARKLGTETRFYGPRECLSNGEIRIAGNGLIYAAPLLIVHNIEAHGYLPPIEFLDALEMQCIEQQTSTAIHFDPSGKIP